MKYGNLVQLDSTTAAGDIYTVNTKIIHTSRKLRILKNFTKNLYLQDLRQDLLDRTQQMECCFVVTVLNFADSICT